MFKRSRKWLIGISLAIVVYVLGSIFFKLIGFAISLVSTLILGLFLLIVVFMIYKIVVVNREATRFEKTGVARAPNRKKAKEK